jgi:hypothetical protein
MRHTIINEIPTYYVYVLRDSGAPDENRYVGGAYGQAKRMFRHTATAGAKTPRKWIAAVEADGRAVIRKVLCTCSTKEEVIWAEAAAWDTYKALGHRLLNDRPHAWPELAGIRGRAVHAANGYAALKRGRATRAAQGYQSLKRALALRAAKGYESLKKGRATQAANGYEALKRGRATDAANGYLSLKNGLATRARGGFQSLKRGRATLAKMGHPNLRRGEATRAASGFIELRRGHETQARLVLTDPDWARRRALKAAATVRERRGR